MPQKSSVALPGYTGFVFVFFDFSLHWFNCSMYKPQELIIPNTFCYLFRLKKNGHVVLFKDIDNVHICTNMILPQIIRDGILGDDKDSVSFFNDIILVTSHVGNEVFLDCECLHNTIPFLPFREILSNPALLHEGITTNNCRLQQFCTEVMAVVIGGYFPPITVLVLFCCCT